MNENEARDAFEAIVTEQGGWWPGIRDAILARFDVTPKGEAAQPDDENEWEYGTIKPGVAPEMVFLLGDESAYRAERRWAERHRVERLWVRRATRKAGPWEVTS